MSAGESTLLALLAYMVVHALVVSAWSLRGERR